MFYHKFRNEEGKELGGHAWDWWRGDWSATCMGHPVGVKHYVGHWWWMSWPRSVAFSLLERHPTFSLGDWRLSPSCLISSGTQLIDFKNCLDTTEKSKWRIWRFVYLEDLSKPLFNSHLWFKNPVLFSNWGKFSGTWKLYSLITLEDLTLGLWVFCLFCISLLTKEPSIFFVCVCSWCTWDLSWII